MNLPTTDRREEILDEIERFDLAGQDEIAVREEIVIKLLTILGYRRDNGDRVRISTPVKLDYVQLGREKRKISKQPDYVLIVDDRPAVIVEAKPPTDPVDFESAAQCLSYAVHERVQAILGVVVNGNELAIYRGALRPDARDPLLRLPRDLWRARWKEIEQLLRPGSLRIARIEIGTDLLSQALPSSTRAIVHVTPGQLPRVELHARDGRPLKVQLEARTQDGASVLSAVANATGAQEIKISSDDVAVRIGDEELNVNEFWGPGVMSLSSIMLPTKVDLYLLAPDGPSGVRIEGRIETDEDGLFILGDEDQGLRLEIRRDHGASIVFAPRRLPVLLGLRTMEFMQALEAQGELVIVDANTQQVVLYGRGTFSVGIVGEFIDLLRKLTYACLRCRIHDLMTPEELELEDANTIVAVYRLLKGESIEQRGRITGLPKDLANSIGTGTSLSLPEYTMTVLGRQFALGAVRVDVSGVEVCSGDSGVIVDGSIVLETTRSHSDEAHR